jgi:hypothetical protein
MSALWSTMCDYTCRKQQAAQLALCKDTMAPRHAGHAHTQQPADGARGVRAEVSSLLYVA